MKESLGYVLLLVRVFALDVMALAAFVAAFGHALKGESVETGLFAIVGLLAAILDRLNNLAPTIQINSKSTTITQEPPWKARDSDA